MNRAGARARIRAGVRDTPCATISNSPTPLRAVFTAPPGSAGSSTSTAALSRASRSIAGPRRRAADFLVATSRAVARRGRLAASTVAGEDPGGRDANREAGLHVEHARPEKPAVAFFDRHPRELADRPDRVEVPDEQNARRRRPATRQDVVARSGAPGSRVHGRAGRLQLRHEQRARRPRARRGRCSAIRARRARATQRARAVAFALAGRSQVQRSYNTEVRS